MSLLRACICMVVDRVHPIVLGIICFIVSAIILRMIFGPLTCADGWASSSIGSRGACSHHGGVETNVKGAVALLIGFVVWGLANAQREINEQIANEPPQPSPQEVKYEISKSIPEGTEENDANLYREYKKSGGTLSFEEWLKSREWMKDTDWSQRQDRRD